MSDNQDNDKNKDKPKVIKLFKNQPSDTEFDGSDTSWENMVDFTLQDHQSYHEQTAAYLKELAVYVEDLHRDVEDSKKVIGYLVKKLQEAGVAFNEFSKKE